MDVYLCDNILSADEKNHQQERGRGCKELTTENDEDLTTMGMSSSNSITHIMGGVVGGVLSLALIITVAITVFIIIVKKWQYGKGADISSGDPQGYHNEVYYGKVVSITGQWSQTFSSEQL